MNVLWMTSLRPLGKSIENDKIQELFVKSVLNMEFIIEIINFIKVRKKYWLIPIILLLLMFAELVTSLFFKK